MNLLEGRKSRPYNMFIPFLSNQTVIARAKSLKIILEQAGLLKDHLFGISGHPSKMNDLKKISSELANYHIPTISLDTPDIVYFWDNQVKTDLLRGNLMRVAVHIAWRAYNVQSREEFRSRITKALNNVAVVYEKRMIRGNSASFSSRKELGEGDILKNIMKNNPELNMLMEIEGEYFDSMDEFHKLIDSLNKIFPGRIWISFDPGHVYIMHKRGKCERPETEFDKLINSNLPLWSFEIDQAKFHSQAKKEDEKVELHTLPWDGDMDMEGMIKKYLHAKISTKHHLVLEVSPIHWEKFIPRIGNYLKNIIF